MSLTLCIQAPASWNKELIIFSSFGLFSSNYDANIKVALATQLVLSCNKFWYGYSSNEHFEHFGVNAQNVEPFEGYESS